jgi:hypothetical protein
MFKYFVLSMLVVVIIADVPIIHKFHSVEPMVETALGGENFENNMTCKLVRENDDDDKFFDIEYINSSIVMILLNDMTIHGCDHLISCSNDDENWSTNRTISILPHLLNITCENATDKYNDGEWIHIHLFGIGFSNCPISLCKLFYGDYTHHSQMSIITNHHAVCYAPKPDVEGCINVAVTNDALIYGSSVLCFENTSIIPTPSYTSVAQILIYIFACLIGIGTVVAVSIIIVNKCKYHYYNHHQNLLLYH